MVINRVPAEGRRDLAVTTNLEELPRLSGVPVRAVIPEGDLRGGVPEALVEALGILRARGGNWWPRREGRSRNGGN